MMYLKRRLAARAVFLTLILSSFMLLALQAGGDFGSLEEILVWIALGGGANALAGAVVSLLLENWSAWHTLPRWVKITVPLAIAGLLGFGANAVLALELTAGVPPVVASLILSMINWFFGQKQYAAIKDGSYGQSARYH